MANVELRNIEKLFDDFVALKDVNLDIATGEFICLLGPSGCGKTTLLRILAGLESKTAGELRVDGDDFSSIPCHNRNIGMVFQSLALFPHLSIGRNIAYGLEIQGVAATERRRKAEELLDIVGLPGLYDRPVSALSGGQKQRVAIARALAIEPVLFLMDEPFSALDAALREHLQIEVKKLQRKLGVTTIFVTHDQREAMTIADRIVILNDGKIEQAGAPIDVYAKPATEFVANFMGDNNIFTAEFLPGEEVTYQGVKLGMPKGDMSSISGSQRLSIRPEYLQLLRNERADGSNELVGRVEFVRLLGASIETELSVGDAVFIHTMVSDRQPEFTVGDYAQISFDLEHALVIPS